MEETLSVAMAVELCSTRVKSIPTLMVTGEITDYKPPNARSGHLYFAVKDAEAKMDVVMWRSSVAKLAFRPENGNQVVLQGKFNLYAPTGKLSFNATKMTLAGDGILRQQVAELERRLAAEGLMDDARKHEPPAFCERVVMITSLTGSVRHDVLRTLRRRNPLVKVEVIGAGMQGATAAPQIIQALREAEALRPDAILLVRGGGSYEDLMCFNDEGLARAIAACTVPVVTGIGHEPDVTIADLVADRRTSTPTHAAESVAPSFNEIIDKTNERQRRLAAALGSLVESDTFATSVLQSRMEREMSVVLERNGALVRELAGKKVLQDPFAMIWAQQERLNMTEQRLLDAGPRHVERERAQVATLGQRLTDSGRRAPMSASLEAGRLGDRLGRSMASTLERANASLVAQAASLEALSPLKVLTRGYAFVTDGEGRVVSSVSDVPVGSTLDIRLADGSVTANVEGVKASNE